MVKKILMVCVIISVFLSTMLPSFAADDGQPVIELNGTRIGADAYIDGRNVYLPLRAVGEALGYDIQWSGKDNIILVSKPGKSISIDLKNYRITADDHTYYMSGDYSGTAVNGGKIIGNSTYMGAGFYSENIGLNVQLDRQNGIVAVQNVVENVISIKTIKEASETEKLKLTLQYPQIQGLEDKAVQDSINAFFVKAAVNAGNEGHQNADELAKDIAGYTGSPNKCETYFDYKVKYNQNGLLSVVFQDYQYTGGAHGMTVQSSHTFNLKTGEEYVLKDLVKSGTDYVSLINDSVKEEIGNRVKEGTLPDNSLAPFETIKSNQGYYLSNNGVVVYFQQYEYYPYAAGIQEFTVEFAALKNMLEPDFSFLEYPINLIEDNSGLVLKERFLRSKEGHGFQLVSWKFTKAFLSGDSSTMKQYLLSPESKDNDYNTENKFDDVEFLILKLSSKDIGSDCVIAEYEFAFKGEDSYTYLFLNMKRVNNEWKVLEYGLEK